MAHGIEIQTLIMAKLGDGDREVCPVPDKIRPGAGQISFRLGHSHRCAGSHSKLIFRQIEVLLCLVNNFLIRLNFFPIGFDIQNVRAQFKRWEPTALTASSFPSFTIGL